MKYVAYYRTRPSEPEASAKALQAQRKAVEKMLAEDNITLSAEFTEREGEEPGSPAYEAAINAAMALRERRDVLDVAIIVTSNGGIGTGEAFLEPSMEEDHHLFHISLSAILDPDLDKIDLPKGAPQALFLYADFHPNQPDTLLYLCNGSSDEITSVEAEIDQQDMNQLFSSTAEEQWKGATHLARKSWPELPQGSCVLVAQRSYIAWDFVSRIRLAFIDGNGRRHTAEADDLNLDYVDSDSSRAWELFSLDE